MVQKSIYTAEYRKFLSKLKKARAESGLTQTQVSKLLDQPQSFISKCESGERRVDIIELVKFAKVYKKGLKYFVEFDKDKL